MDHIVRAMFLHFKNDGLGRMPATKKAVETEQFTITLNRQTVEMLEKLVEIGLHGNSRGEVVRTLVSSGLEALIARGLIDPKK